MEDDEVTRQAQENLKKSNAPGEKANGTLTKPKDTKPKGAKEAERDRGRNSERSKKTGETEI